MTTVLFNDVNEFLEELEAEVNGSGSGVLSNIVRVTNLNRPFVMKDDKGQKHVQPFIRHVYLLVTYLRGPEEIIRLERYVGDQWDGMTDQNERTWALATALRQKILDACAAHGLQVRGGEVRAGGDSGWP